MKNNQSEHKVNDALGLLVFNNKHGFSKKNGINRYLQEQGFMNKTSIAIPYFADKASKILLKYVVPALVATLFAHSAYQVITSPSKDVKLQQEKNREYQNLKSFEHKVFNYQK